MISHKSSLNGNNYIVPITGTVTYQAEVVKSDRIDFSPLAAVIAGCLGNCLTETAHEREEARRKKGLPPRVVLLPDWDKDDEQRYDEDLAKKRPAGRRRKAPRKPKASRGKAAGQVKTGVAPAPERKN